MNLQFHFEATDEQGMRQSGPIEATDQVEAATRLRNRGWTVLTLESALIGQPAGPSPLREREVIGLLEQLHALTRAGLPLPSGLHAASAELESGPLRTTFADLSRQLAQGQGLDEALIAQANRFPAHLQALVRAGVRSGRLADVLGEIVQASNLGHELRRQIRATLAYPGVVLLIVLGLSGFLCHLSSQILESILPAGQWDPDTTQMMETTTQALLALTRFIATYDLWLVLGLVGTGGGSYLVWRFLISPPIRDRYFGSLPLVGPLARYIALAEFCHLAAVLVEAETPLPEAIDLAGASVGDAALAEDCRATAGAVAAGQPLSKALQTWTTLPAGLGQLLAWGEAQQSLDAALRFAGDLFEARATAQAMFTKQVFSATLLLMILWWIGFAIATIYLPITMAIQSVSKLI